MADHPAPTFRVPPGYHEPLPPSHSPPPTPVVGERYESANVKGGLVSRREVPIYSIRRRWRGFDVAASCDKFAAGQPIVSLFAYANHNGVRTLLASGRLDVEFQGRVMSVRNVIADTVDITALCAAAPAGIAGKTMSVAILASDQCQDADESAGLASLGRMLDVAAPQQIGSFSSSVVSPAPYTGSVVLESVDVVATPAAIAAGLWLTISAPAGFVVWSCQVTGAVSSYDLRAMLKSQRWLAGVFVQASTSPAAIAAPAAGLCYANVWYR